MDKLDERVIGDPLTLTADETLRAIVGQLWENDNDTGELEIVLEGYDGTQTNIIFEMRIKSINGAKVEEAFEEDV